MSTETVTVQGIDRATLALLDRLGIKPEDADDLPEADVTVALVLRVIRDDLYIAWQEGEVGAASSIHPMLDVERYLNDRIAALSGRSALTGDTTVPGFPGFPTTA